MVDATIIICTHNPRPHYLDRVLAALRNQSLPYRQWELLLIDNASEPALAPRWDILWHPNARHIRESELGLAVARRHGIMEAAGDLLIFVDDDNILAGGLSFRGSEDLPGVANAWNMGQRDDHSRV